MTPAAREAGVTTWFVAREEAPPVEEPAGGWAIQIEADRDDEVTPGPFVILSKLTLPPLPQFEGGSPTTKVFKTVVSGEKRSKTEQVFKAEAAAWPSPAPPVPHLPSPPLQPAAQAFSEPSCRRPRRRCQGAAPVNAPRSTPVRGLAEIALADNLGPRVFVMDKPDIKIGRGGQFRLVDLQLDAPIRISRVHARIRRDDQGRFFIKDLSEWGITVNGNRIARGVTKEGDEVREIDVEAELPARARIGLADVVFLEFTAAPSSVDTRTSEIPTGVVGDLEAGDTVHREPGDECAGLAALSVRAAAPGSGGGARLRRGHDPRCVTLPSCPLLPSASRPVRTSGASARPTRIASTPIPIAAASR